MNLPRISVIITAYNRKDFLMEAINSVLDQRMDPSEYELIVVTNFHMELDHFSPNLDISSIMMDGAVGEFIYAGIKASKYEIISFLDDDDAWESDKIARVLGVFRNDEKTMYYHNSYLYMDSYGNQINYSRMVESRLSLSLTGILSFDSLNEMDKFNTVLSMNGDFNLSCISVRRSALEKYLELLKMITGGTDAFFFWTSIISGGMMLIDSKKLTRYRVRELNVIKSIGFRGKTAEIGRQIRTYSLLINYLNKDRLQIRNKTLIERWINLIKLEYELNQIIFLRGERAKIIKKAGMLYRYGRKFKSTLKCRLLFFCGIYLISPKISIYIYEKISR